MINAEVDSPLSKGTSYTFVEGDVDRVEPLAELGQLHAALASAARSSGVGRRAVAAAAVASAVVRRDFEQTSAVAVKPDVARAALCGDLVEVSEWRRRAAELAVRHLRPQPPNPAETEASGGMWVTTRDAW